MKNEFITYEQAVALKELGLILDNNIGGFYAKPNSKMFSIDEKGRYYRIRNATKKIYIYGTHFVLNDKNVFGAPLKQQVFRWFREKYEAYSTISTELEEGLYYRIFIQRNEPIVFFSGIFYTYEEAENACIDKLIELAKNQSL